MKKIVLLVNLTLLLIFSGFTHAQAPLARCFDMARSLQFIILENGYMFQENYPANSGTAMRDPSGQTFLRLASRSPMTESFFITWQGQLVELNVYRPGPTVIGNCQLLRPLPPPPPRQVIPSYAWTDGRGVISNGHILPVPQQFYQRSIGISPPPNARLTDANFCMRQSGGDTTAFMDCLVPKMMTNEQVVAYQCMRQSNDETAMATCLAGQMMGHNERRALQQAEVCYREYGNNWSSYPLCMAGQNFDPKMVVAVNCIRAQAESANTSVWGVAGCIAGNSLNLNPELTVAVECAMSSGGEPITFAGCTGGRLTAMELNKCFTHGVGGSGCFGDNNEIVKGLRTIGVDLHQIMGPNGFAVRNWNNAVNDFQRGPGPNNEINRAIQTINNDLQYGMGKNNDIRRALEDVGLGGLF